MRAEALKGHLGGLLLAALEDGPRHGYAVKEARGMRPRAGSTCPPAPFTRRCIGWSEPD
ncbi:hypothetical protein GCM10022419_047400 [Nonomuraea rosea]|uniref:PadR family transcriptional regulator n=1 Tax=Nonomuraea rosea TaxID=638574 RepID=A0ABP6X4A4_9ACTN